MIICLPALKPEEIIKKIRSVPKCPLYTNYWWNILRGSESYLHGDKHDH